MIKKYDPTTSKKRSTLVTTLTVARWLLLDTPYLLLLLVFGACHFAMYFHDHYVTPQFDLLHWNKDRAKTEVTYYKRLCTAADQTTFEPEDLILSDDMTSEEMVDSMLTHGISVVPNLLDPNTAAELRASIVKHNVLEENFGVISNKHRYSYGIRMEQDPIVRKAVRDISTHPQMQKLLPGLIGADPALYKFHGITSAAGTCWIRCRRRRRPIPHLIRCRCRRSTLSLGRQGFRQCRGIFSYIRSNLQSFHSTSTHTRFHGTDRCVSR